ncbi:MAG: ROK family protein [Sphaerochaetaceae bacterium]|nr:ROK family protein [Sphaerochaetaceae bacterium]MDD4396868.1 ROK family protein [Sphaerochaetaceae bacterium]
MDFSIAEYYKTYGYSQKAVEKASIFETIVNGDETTRKRLNQIYKVRPNNITLQVQELINQGLVIEGQPVRSSKQGRPEILLKANPGKLVSIGIWVESDKLSGAVLDMNGKLYLRHSVQLGQDTGNAEFQKALFELIDLISSRVSSNQIITGIGLSLPGFSDITEQKWIFNSRWPGVSDYDFSAVRARYGLPLSLDQKLESELAAIIGKNKRYQDKNIFLVHWGFGIGGAYSHQGMVMHSKFGSFAEIGHTKVQNPRHLKCKCGELDCVETIASGWALLPYLRQKMGTVPENETDLGRLLSKAHFESDPVIKEAIQTISQVMSMVYRIFCPDLVLFYGPFTMNMFVRQELRGETDSIAPSYAKGVELQFLDKDLSEYDPLGAAMGFIKDELVRQLMPASN